MFTKIITNDRLFVKVQPYPFKGEFYTNFLDNYFLTTHHSYKEELPKRHEK